MKQQPSSTVIRNNRSIVADWKVVSMHRKRMADSQKRMADSQTHSVTKTGTVMMVVLAIVALMLVPRAGDTIKRSSLAIRAPYYQLDNEEGALLFQAMELRAGRSIYRALNTYPYVAATYTPIYLATNALLVDPDTPSLAGGRILSLIGALASGLCVGLLVWLRTRALVPAITASLLFVATYEVFHWVGYYRVDFFGLMFSLGGLSVFAWGKQRRWSKALSIALFVLGFFTRQTLLAAPVAACAALLMEDRRAGMRYTAAMIAALLVPWLILTAITRGQFAVHTVWYNMNTFVPGDLLVWGKHLLRFNWALLAAGLAAGFLLMRRADGQDASTLIGRSILIYSALAILSAIAIGKKGSAENYLLETLVAFAILSCTAAAVAGSSMRFCIVVLLLLHAGWLWLPYVRKVAFGEYVHAKQADIAAANTLTSKLRNQQGRAICERALYNLLAGRSIEFQPFIMSELTRQRKWDPKSFFTDLEGGEFPLVISNYDFASGGYTDDYAPEMIQIMRGNYTETSRLQDMHNVYFVYSYSRR